jgi:hypothetical protein
VSAYNLSFASSLLRDRNFDGEHDHPAVSAITTVDDMTPPVIARWIDIIENGRTADLEDLLTQDAVFYSPAVFSAQEGREKTLAYLSAAAKMFDGTDFHYVEHGIDMIHWNDDEKIVSVKVMMRPMKGLQAIMPKMAELLQLA